MKCSIINFFINTIPDIGDTLGNRINNNFQVQKSASLGGVTQYPSAR